MSKAVLKTFTKRRLGVGDGLVKTASNQFFAKWGFSRMADDKVHPTATEMDYPAHFRNYDGFVKMLKYSAIVGFVTVMLVIYVIYN